MQKMQKQRGAVEIVLVVLLVIAIGAAGWFWWQGRKVSTSTSVPSPTPTTIVSPVPIADWGEYSNSKYNFLIRYPGENFYEDNSFSYEIVSESFNVFFDMYSPYQDIKLVVEIVENYSKDKLDEYLEEKQFTKDMVGGEKAFRYKRIFDDKDYFNPAVYAKANEYILIYKDSNLYIISFHIGSQRLLDDNKELIDQILSTFEFVE